MFQILPALVAQLHEVRPVPHRVEALHAPKHRPGVVGVGVFPHLVPFQRFLVIICVVIGQMGWSVRLAKKKLAEMIGQDDSIKTAGGEVFGRAG